MRNFKNILITGGSGFIGSNFIRYLLTDINYTGQIINLDVLTYAANPYSLDAIKNNYSNYKFLHADINKPDDLINLFTEYDLDLIIHFAAESHVDRSIHGPADFINTNIVGTFNLLQACRKYFEDGNNIHFHHISTDEVFGSLKADGFFYETTAYSPNSPYSASKAASDHLVNAYYHTYALPITMSNCSNNYGPYQFPEKLIPLMVLNCLNKKPLPVYGDGKNIRDWLHVNDHAQAIWLIVTSGKIGECYNIGAQNEWKNIDIVHLIIKEISSKTNADLARLERLISFVEDRKGHDFRYAINCDKIKNELGYKIKYSFSSGLSETIDWYLENSEWVAGVTSGKYLDWLKLNYS